MYNAIHEPSNEPSIFKQKRTVQTGNDVSRRKKRKDKLGVRMKKPMKMVTNKTIKARSIKRKEKGITFILNK